MTNEDDEWLGYIVIRLVCNWGSWVSFPFLLEIIDLVWDRELLGLFCF